MYPPMRLLCNVGRRLLLSMLLGLLLTGCHADVTPVVQPSAAPQDLDRELRDVIALHEATGDPSLGRTIPAIEDPLAQLGKRLFFTKSLSVAQDTACASCHLPTLGGGDALSLSIGVNADDPDLIGPGRTHATGAPLVPRNAPTTFNIVMWDQALFHDGRVESLGKTPGANGADGRGIRTPDVPLGQADPRAGTDLAVAQSRFPVTAEAEMRGRTSLGDEDNDAVRAYLAARLSGHAVESDAGYADRAGKLSGSNYWLEQFAQVFGQEEASEPLITEQRIAQALGAYECTQVFVDTPWRAYVQGEDAALSDAAKRGALLFFRSRAEGGVGCASCHSGDFFTDEQFHVLAVPQVGPGKGDGSDGTHDFGRYRETGEWDDLYAFRTPSLLNVAATGPYGHDGAYATLDAIVRHHLDPAGAAATYDTDQLDPLIQTERATHNTQLALLQLQRLRWLERKTARPAVLSDAQTVDLIAFLHALTDPCVLDETCLAPWMPADMRDPHGLRPITHTR